METICDISTEALEGATGLYVGVFSGSDVSDDDGCFSCRLGDTVVSYFPWGREDTFLEAVEMNVAQQRRIEGVTFVSDNVDIGHIICVLESRGRHCVGFSNLEMGSPALVSIVFGGDEWILDRFSPNNRSVVEVWLD